MSDQCELVELISQASLSIRLRTAAQDLAQVFGKGYGEMARYLGEIGVQPAGPPFAVYYNMDLDDLDVEFGFPLANSVEGKDAMRTSETPGGTAASCLHVGPYADVEPAYNALFQWIQDHGYEPTGIAYEQYLNDPEQTPAERLQTQIFLLVRATR